VNRLAGLRATTDEEYAAIGARMYADPSKITTNIEGSAYLSHCGKIDRENIAKHGCCGREPDREGYCFGVGMCPRHQEATQAVEFCNGYLKWLEQINELTNGLADDTARHCVSSPVIESELSHV